MEIRRRTYLTQPGEALVLATSASLIASRNADFINATGLTQDDVHSSPLVTYPIPLLPESGRWPATMNPAALWHPLFWLPELIANPLEDEDYDQWAIRVCLEIVVSGLYDVETATWTDALSTVGLDGDDPQTQARIRHWLAGNPDPDLDRINLSIAYADEGRGTWAIEQADNLYPIITQASWAILSGDLAQQLSYSATRDNITVEDLAHDTRTVIYLAQGVLGDEIPAADETSEPPAQLWERVFDDIQHWQHRSREDVVNGPLHALHDSLTKIRDDYWVFVEALNEANDEAAA